MRWIWIFLLPVWLSAYTPVTIPNGTKLPYKIVNGVKEFHLIAEPMVHEFCPGMKVNCWGFNGQTPGPVIEAVEGDRVRIFVTNKLPETTTVHWHGLILPNGMDGVYALTQPGIEPGETFVYEFTLRQNGTFMYHPHFDDITQIGMGMMGFFIIHPKDDPYPVDRDFLIMLMAWSIPPGAYTPNVMTMDLNFFTFNSCFFPKTESLVVKKGEKVRIRYGNLSLIPHPIHLHGYEFIVTRLGGKRLPKSAQYSDVTVNVPVGTTRDIEFVANNPGDWAIHCHITHHAGMNGMGDSKTVMLNTELGEIADRIAKLIPGYAQMGVTGFGKMFTKHHRQMPRPDNFVPWGVPGQFGDLELSGMFTVLKVREHLKNYNDPGWYKHPRNTTAHSVNSY